MGLSDKDEDVECIERSGISGGWKVILGWRGTAIHIDVVQHEKQHQRVTIDLG